MIYYRYGVILFLCYTGIYLPETSFTCEEVINYLEKNDYVLPEFKVTAINKMLYELYVHKLITKVNRKEKKGKYNTWLIAEKLINYLKTK